MTLRANAAESGDAELARPSYYTIEYATVSSRGTKIYCCKYCITNKRLYVLQAQANLDAFDGEEGVHRLRRRSGTALEEQHHRAHLQPTPHC